MACGTGAAEIPLCGDSSPGDIDNHVDTQIHRYMDTYKMHRYIDTKRDGWIDR